MGARKDERRKLARKVIRRVLPEYAEALAQYEPDTDAMTDREFDALVAEIRAAKVTVTWKAGT